MSEGKKPPEKVGIFLTKEMTIDISSFDIFIDETGKKSSNGPTIYTGLDVCPYWLEIAYDNLVETEKIHDNLLIAVRDQNDSLTGELLQKEFLKGMQVVMANCIAIDAYYASIKRFAKIPEELTKKWRENRTARHAADSRNPKKSILSTGKYFSTN